jgi:hypothetical protein
VLLKAKLGLVDVRTRTDTIRHAVVVSDGTWTLCGQRFDWWDDRMVEGSVSGPNDVDCAACRKVMEEETG